jgi:hypothetical protein
MVTESAAGTKAGSFELLLLWPLLQHGFAGQSGSLLGLHSPAEDAGSGRESRFSKQPLQCGG